MIDYSPKLVIEDIDKGFKLEVRGKREVFDVMITKSLQIYESYIASITTHPVGEQDA